MYFIAQSCLHVVINFPRPPNPTKICCIFPLSTGHYSIPQNFAAMQKFRGNGQIPWLGSKFCMPRKTVVPIHQYQLANVYSLLLGDCRGNKIHVFSLILMNAVVNIHQHQLQWRFCVGARGSQAPKSCPAPQIFNWFYSNFAQPLLPPKR